ncbi:MAG: hypothetical protein ABW123_09565 [Cystobacter sp.]
MTRIRWILLALGAAAVGPGCTIEAPDFSGKSCMTTADCPVPHTCVAARPGAGRTCEILRGPDSAEPPADGPVPTWCADVQPVMAASCVSACHGSPETGNVRPGFRLDVYETAGGVLGARDMAARIRERAVVQRTMPPPGGVEPTEAQRALLERWATGGTPLCAQDTPGDAGSPDGG